MNQVSIQYYKTKIGEFILGSFENKLCLLDYRYRRMRNTVDKRIQTGLNAVYLEQDNELLRETRKQVDEYLAGGRREFDLPLLLVGTDFQKTVWEKLLTVEYGTTVSYLQLAKSLTNEKAIRAVAAANGANALSLIVPCHRIVGSDGKLVGYGGGISVKKRLLRIEKEHSNQEMTLF